MEMERAMPSVFVFESTELIISYDSTDKAKRKNLFGTAEYYLVGTLNDAARTETSKAFLTIDFQDACQSITPN